MQSKVTRNHAAYKGDEAAQMQFKRHRFCKRDTKQNNKKEESFNERRLDIKGLGALPKLLNYIRAFLCTIRHIEKGRKRQTDGKNELRTRGRKSCFCS